MTEQEAQEKIKAYNKAALYGSPPETFNQIVHDLAEDGRGVAWNGDEGKYVLTGTPDMSMLVRPEQS